MKVNPHVKLTFTRDEIGIATIKLEAPIKHEGLRVTTLSRSNDVGLFTFLLMYTATPSAGHVIEMLLEAERARLAEMGFLVDDGQVSSPVRFECDAESLPMALVPERAKPAVARSAAADEDLVVDPTARVYGAEGPPKAMRGRYDLANPFQSQRVWFSVDGDLSTPSFRSSDLELGAQLERLLDGRLSPADLSIADRERLSNTGVLRTASDIEERRNRRAGAVAAAHQALGRDRHVLLSELIRPEQIAAIRQYYRSLLDEGFVRYGDAEWPNRYFSSRDPLTHFFQTQMTSLVSEVAGQKLKPSFSFFTSYRPGSHLPAHRDREQCYLAMTVLLDHGQPDDFSSWPVYVQATETSSPVEVHSGLGDGLLYFGEEVLHWRHTLTSGYSTHWFLFWVPETFAGSLE